MLKAAGHLLTLSFLLACANEPKPIAVPPREPLLLESALDGVDAATQTAVAVSRTQEVETQMRLLSRAADTAEKASDEHGRAVALYGLASAVEELRSTASAGSILDLAGAALDQFLGPNPSQPATALGRWASCGRMTFQTTPASRRLGRPALEYAGSDCAFEGQANFELDARTLHDGRTTLSLYSEFPNGLLERASDRRIAPGGRMDVTISTQKEADGRYTLSGIAATANFCIEPKRLPFETCFTDVSLDFEEAVDPTLSRRDVSSNCDQCDNLYGHPVLDDLRGSGHGFELSLGGRPLRATARGRIRLPGGRLLQLNSLAFSAGTEPEPYAELDGTATVRGVFGSSMERLDMTTFRIVRREQSLVLTGCVSRGTGQQTCFESTRLSLSRADDGITVGLHGEVGLSDPPSTIALMQTRVTLTPSVARLEGGVAIGEEAFEFEDFVLKPTAGTTRIQGGITTRGRDFVVCENTTLGRSGRVLSFEGCVEVHAPNDVHALGTLTEPFVASIDSDSGVANLDGLVSLSNGRNARLHQVRFETIESTSDASTHMILRGIVEGASIFLSRTLLDFGEGLDIVLTAEGFQFNGRTLLRSQLADTTVAGTIDLADLVVRPTEERDGLMTLELAGRMLLDFPDARYDQKTHLFEMGNEAGFLTLMRQEGTGTSTTTFEGMFTLCAGCDLSNEQQSKIVVNAKQLAVAYDACGRQLPFAGRAELSGNWLADRTALSARANTEPPLSVSCECNESHEGTDLLYATNAIADFDRATPVSGFITIRGAEGYCSHSSGAIDSSRVISCSNVGRAMLPPPECP